MNISATLSGIRIARVSTVPFFVVAQLKTQIASLARQGAQVTVITSDEPELSLLEGLTGVTCVPIDIPRSISPWRDLLALRQLFIFFKRENIHITHSTTPKAGLLTALAAFFAGVPVRLHTFTGQPWITMYGAKRWLARAGDKLIGKLNTRCYADSPGQRQFLVAQRLVSAKQLFVIGSGSLAGVDVRRFDRRRFSGSQREALRRTLGIPDDAPVVLFVGRIAVDKGVRELLRAFSLLKGAGSNAHLILVGRLDTESGVQGAILPSDISGLLDVHVVGHTESPEEFLAIADLLCLPSYREGFGTVIIEAAAMSVPAVGTDIYGLSDAVVQGETGLLVPPRNISELENAIRKLIEDKSLRLRMGEAARRRVLVHFDAGIFDMQVAEEYRSLLLDEFKPE